MAEKYEIIPFNDLGLNLQDLEQMERNFASANRSLTEAQIVRGEKAIRYKVNSSEFREAKTIEDQLNSEIKEIKISTNEILNNIESDIQDNSDIDPYSKALYGSIFSYKPHEFAAGNHREAAEQGYTALVTIIGRLSVKGQPILTSNSCASTDDAKLIANNNPGSHLLALSSKKPVSFVNSNKNTLDSLKLATTKNTISPLIGNDKRSNVDYLSTLAENNDALIIGKEAVEQKVQSENGLNHIASILVLESAGFNFSELLNKRELKSIKNTLINSLISPVTPDDIYPRHGAKISKRTIHGLCDIAGLNLEDLHKISKKEVMKRLKDPDVSLGQIKVYSQILDNLYTTIKNLA